MTRIGDLLTRLEAAVDGMDARNREDFEHIKQKLEAGTITPEEEARMVALAERLERADLDPDFPGPGTPTEPEPTPTEPTEPVEPPPDLEPPPEPNPPEEPL